MILHQNGSRPARPAPSDWFQGNVLMTPVLTEAEEPARQRSLIIDFAAGARTAWHTHPAGQMLFILSGEGRAQVRGGPVVVLRAGDTVWFPPGEEHWHGAAPDHAMTHLAVQETHDGRSVDWLDPVSETDYARSPG